MTDSKPQPPTQPTPRTTIAVTLDPEAYAKVCSEAAADDRTPAMWLKRFVQRQLSTL